MGCGGRLWGALFNSFAGMFGGDSDVSGWRGGFVGGLVFDFAGGKESGMKGDTKKAWDCLRNPVAPLVSGVWKLGPGDLSVLVELGGGRVVLGFGDLSLGEKLYPMVSLDGEQCLELADFLLEVAVQLRGERGGYGWVGQNDRPACSAELKVDGLTLRDYFAVAALPQLLRDARQAEAVKCVYDIADLMLKERALSPEERQREDRE